MFDNPTAEDAIFEVLDDEPHVMRLHVAGTGFAARAMPLRAMVGDVEVHHIITWIGGDGFTGVLDETPADGDTLRIGWADGGDLADTPVIYHAGGIV